MFVSHSNFRSRPGRQRGVTILIALVAMLVLLFSGMALIRSFQSSAMFAGNMAFKRDLVNQGERAVKFAWSALATGGVLGTDALRQTSNVAKNYSATKLPSTANGVPLALLTDTDFGDKGTAANDFVGDSSGTKVRYIIDRLCGPGTTSESDAACSMAYQVSKVTGTSDFQPGQDGQVGAGAAQKSVYRISVRVSSVRGTVVYLQTAVTL